MVKVVVAKSFGLNLALIDLDGLLTEGISLETTPTKIVINYGGGERDEFYGSGFVYKNGIPVAGTVKSYKTIVNNKEVVTATGASLKASDVIKAALSANPEAAGEKLLQKVLGKADTFSGGNKVDIFNAYGGNDKLNGYSGNDMLYGGSGNDQVYGEAGNDTLFGDKGNDLVAGGAGNDTQRGGEGNDEVLGGSGNDKLYGDAGADTLNGNNGRDILEGGAGRDTLLGGAGNDTLYGGVGKDTLSGGSGDDRFIYKSLRDSTVAAGGQDTISNFAKSANDKIDLSAIDANTSFFGDQAFSFIGAAGFTGAGQLRAVASGNSTYIYGNVNSDTKADFVIHLDKAFALTTAEFVL